jgi:MFS family permease
MVKAIVRALLGVLAGLVVMFVVITAIEYVAHQIFPPPGLDPRNPADLAAVLASQPVAGLAMVVLAWVCGAFAGGWLAARISTVWPRAAAVIIALVVMSGVVGMIVQLPAHPKWMSMLGLLLPIPAALLAARLARRKPTPGL